MVQVIRNSKYLQCPLPVNFFAKLGKAHSSHIRRELAKSWKMRTKEMGPLLRERLRVHGNVGIVNRRLTRDWEGAFLYADDWNRYPGYNKDKALFESELSCGNWVIESGEFVLDDPTWLTLASLCFSRDAEKESPNHLFLKELFTLHIQRNYPSWSISDEQYLVVYGERIRCDVICKEGDNIVLIGEMGGVQLWKVMALLYKYHHVMVLPHWTEQKLNPFTRKKLHYQYYIFKGKEVGA